MSLFGIFGRRAIRDPAALAGFLDGQALSSSEQLVQDYARDRAGAQADAVFAAPAFGAALERARWEAYPRLLAMMAELAEGLLRARAGANGHAVLSGLIETVLTAFDRHAAPPAIGAADWRVARNEVERSLNELADRPPRPINSIVDSHASYCLAVMPIDPRLQADDFPALRNQLVSCLSAANKRLAEEADLPGLARALAAGAPAPPANAG